MVLGSFGRTLSLHAFIWSQILYCVVTYCSTMDTNADVTTIKAEPVEHVVNAVEVLYTDIDIEYTYIKEECLNKCSEIKQKDGGFYHFLLIYSFF